MYKMMFAVFTVLMFYATNVVNARIWFVGDQMPGSNRTITDDEDDGPFTNLTTISWMSSAKREQVNLDRVEKIIGRGITRMALSLENVIGNEKDNLVFAPVSVAAALSIILLGSAGKTNTEIAQFLGIIAGVDFTDRTQIVHTHLGKYFTKFEQNPGFEVGTHLSFASGVFVQEGFPIKPEFDESARKIYRCEVLPLDFLMHPEDARQVVNQWVANRTEGRIKEILADHLNPLTSVIVANAFYFNGQWENPFFGKTRVGPFYVSKNEVIQMPLMVSGAEIPYLHTKDYRLIGMPYKGGDLVMYIVLPQKNLHSFVSDLTVESIEDMINHTSIQTVLYVVPRMKMESTLNLRKPLEELGLRSLFDPKTADLSGISQGTFASNVYHKVEIQVTETGTIAAAGTASGLIRGGVPVVRVDKPFLFFIYHNPTNTIMFWGSVYKPTPFYN